MGAELRAAAERIVAMPVDCMVCPSCGESDRDIEIVDNVRIATCQTCGFDGDESYWKAREIPVSETEFVVDFARQVIAAHPADDGEPFVGIDLWEMNYKRLSYLVKEIDPGLNVVWCPPCGDRPPLLCVNTHAIKENPTKRDVRRLLAALQGE